MEQVNCSEHGENELVLSCQHLTKKFKNEVYLIPSELNEDAQAWCGVCETARIKDKGWYDYADSIASWKVICSKCLSVIINNAKEVIEVEGIDTPYE